MKLLEELLKDNIIDRSTLVIKRHEYLGLDATQAAFVAKIFINNNECYKDIDINEVSELMGVDTETSKAILESLITKGLLLVSENENNTPIFNFDFLITKLLNCYETPIASSTIEKKLTWIETQVEFEVNEQMKEEFKKVISGMEWEILVELIKKSTQHSEQTFPLLMSLINSSPINKESKDNKVKEILEVNWLK